MTMSKIKILVVLLALSIVGNLMLLGVAGGKYAAGQKAHEDTQKRGESSLSKMMKEMSPEKRKEVEAANADLQKQLVVKRKELKQQGEYLESLMRRRNVEKTELETAYATYREMTTLMQSISHAMLINALMELSPAERKQVAGSKKDKPEKPKKPNERANKPHKNNKN